MRPIDLRTRPPRRTVGGSRNVLVRLLTGAVLGALLGAGPAEASEPPEFDFWVSARPELALVPAAPMTPVWLARGELGFGKRSGRVFAWAILGGGALGSFSAQEVTYKSVAMVHTGGVVGSILPGPKVNGILGLRTTLDVALISRERGPQPFVSMGGVLGLELPGGHEHPRVRVTFEPGVVMPFPSLSLAVSVGVAFM